MSQRRKVFSPAVQDLFAGDGMVEDSGPPTLEEWERIVRQMDDNLSAYVGDRKKARRILLNAFEPRERRIFKALLVGKRKRGRPPGDGGRVARQKEAWLDLYNRQKAKDPKMGLSKFAKWLHEEMGHGASVESTRKKLNGNKIARFYFQLSEERLPVDSHSDTSTGAAHVLHHRPIRFRSAA